jgi:predicted glycogen debranching enzyme
MGTAAGVNTRRYHGLLVAALRPPSDRFVLLSKLQETALIDGEAHELGTAQYPGAVHPHGFGSLESFRLDPFPIWTWAFDGTRIEKQVFLMRGKQTVVVLYRADRECGLLTRPFLAYRDFHALTHANERFDGCFIEERLSHHVTRQRVTPYETLPTLSFHHNGRSTDEGAVWYYQTEYLVELERGLDFREDLCCLGSIYLNVSPERPAWLVASIEVDDSWNWGRVAAEEAVERERRRSLRSAMIAKDDGAPSVRSAFVSSLTAAADAFWVRRADGSPTIIAGYPWFADWGRDTMIALPGLLLSRGLLDGAREVLDGFLAHVDGGLIPNRFADSGQPPEYNTVDATLWMFQAVEAYLRAGGDRHWAQEVFYPKGKDIVAWHERGTRHGIGVDASDGLLVGGAAGSQLTWMDAKIGDWVVTPRHGKAVEVNALWFNALSVMGALARDTGDVEGLQHFASAAKRVRGSFLRAFWNVENQCLFDVILPEGPDARMRPNQIFAVSLPYRMLSPDQEQCVVRAVERDLLTPVGLRTLAPGEEGYRPHYGGDAVSRDSAYHQGTVWPWLLGPYVTAYLNAFGRDRARLEHAASLVRGLEEHLREGMLGQIPEVFDAEPPRRPGGAPAQAWSVAEILRLLMIELS